MSTLPEDIIFTEILPRISSIKSLLKFKSVSKPWYSLISSQNFVKTQLDKSLVKNASLPAIIISSNNRYFVKTQLEKSLVKSTSLPAVLISRKDRCFAVGHCDVDVLFSQDDTSVDQFDIDYPHSYFTTGDSITGVAGCCNGLYCILLLQKRFILVNPSTRKYHKLPPLADNEPTVATYGYGEYNGDYKVFTQFRSNSPYGLVSKLYSLKTNSWKTVQVPFAYNKCNGVFLNGKLHWASRAGSYPNYNMKIETFDLGSEIVGLLEHPSFAHGLCQYPDLMSVIQGCLCLVHCKFDKVTDVWVMKEYGVKDSWCKLLTLPYFGQCFGKEYKVPIPKCISQEGEVLVELRRSLIYNPITETRKYLKVNKSTHVLGIGIGIQSLVSPFPRGV